MLLPCPPILTIHEHVRDHIKIDIVFNAYKFRCDSKARARIVSLFSMHSELSLFTLHGVVEERTCSLKFLR